MLVGVVRRQQRRDVNVDRKQVANRAVVFRSIQPVERLAASGIGMGQRHRVDFAFEPRRHTAVGGVVGTRAVPRRHRLRPKLDQDFLPRFRVGRDVGQVLLVERKIGGQGPLVVATDTIAVEHRLRLVLCGDGRRQH